MRPLSALCLMAGHGIGVLDLQGIEISILANRLHAVGLQWHKVLIVFLHLPEELLLLLVGKGRRLALQGVEHTRHLHLVIIIVGQLQQQCGKVEPIQLDIVAHPQHLSPVAIGKKGRNSAGTSLPALLLLLLRPEVVVLHDHEHIARREFLLTVEHHVPDTIIIYIGALVASGDDHRLVHPHMMITVAKTLHQLCSRHHHDIGKALEAYQRKSCHSIMGYHLSDEGGIIEDARRLTLSQHLIEVALVNLQTVSLHHRCAEGRRLLLAHRGQLCLVAYEQQAVVMSLIHKLHQVVEQTSTAESCSPQPHIGYHRSLVHHEERVGVKIVVQTELTVNTGKSLLSVDAAMDGIGRSPTAQREHLGSPARRGKEHHLLAYLQQGTHDGSRKRGLSRTGTASQYHHCLRVAVGQKTDKSIECLPLLLRRSKAKLLQYLIF